MGHVLGLPLTTGCLHLLIANTVMSKGAWVLARFESCKSAVRNSLVFRFTIFFFFCIYPVGFSIPFLSLPTAGHMHCACCPLPCPHPHRRTDVHTHAECRQGVPYSALAGGPIGWPWSWETLVTWCYSCILPVLGSVGISIELQLPTAFSMITGRAGS